MADGVGAGSNRPPPPFYNSAPYRLLLYDIRLLISLIGYLPGVFLPLTPALSGPLDELYPSFKNLWGIFLHNLLMIAQIIFLASLFFCIIPTAGLVVIYILGFFFLNYFICLISLNGRDRFITSDVDLSQFPRHDNERWIFINGVAVGHHWLHGNVNLLAKTFGREILGAHNQTYGFLFDLIQCIIERDLLYTTQDTRDSYVLVKRALEDPRYEKVVLILHSQGGIQGSLIVDMLIAALSEAHLRKLEVYTFASAANHFNNPVRGAVAENLIRHVEHYANSDDLVSRWGVLNFIDSPTHLTNHFVGRLFERPGSGHMLNQHYLDTMFPLDPDTGLVADTNEFMEMLVDENLILGSQNIPAIDTKLAMALGHTTTMTTPRRRSTKLPDGIPGNMKPIKELSRLWKYRNGQSPLDGVPGNGKFMP